LDAAGGDWSSAGGAGALIGRAELSRAFGACAIRASGPMNIGKYSNLI